ncbi:MAG TPA: MarR family transcriptional regulator [Rhodothermales bacterium]|nr:MarR family transcriptional regulator [Rhodothermales bacterium]
MKHLSDHVSYLSLRLGRALNTFRAVELGTAGVHCGQDLLLMALGENGRLRPSDLADQLGVEPPTVTKMLQRMEAAGMISRSPDPADARVSWVQLTKEGRHLEVHVEGCWEAAEARAVAGLNVEERLLLRLLLAHVLANMEQMPVE